MVVIAARLAYDGTDFAGFQRQVRERTVQGVVEAGLAELYGRPVTIRGAGRTDAGVHAAGQVIAWEATEPLPPERAAEALNGRLPADVAARASWRAPDGFDPRRDAIGRVYRYTLAVDRRRDPLRDRFAWRVAPGLDLALMRDAAGRLVGEWEFGSLSCENGYTGSRRRTVRRIDWEQVDERVTCEIEGDSFLYKQVRCSVGVLVAIGRGQQPPELIDRLLAGAPRPVQVAVAPPTGLVLQRVVYGPAAGVWQ